MTKEVFDHLISTSKSGAFVFWRLPNQDQINCMIDEGHSDNTFVIAPFQPNEQTPLIRIKGNRHEMEQLDFNVDHVIPTSHFQGTSTERTTYSEGIELAVNTISNSEIDKVVVSTQTFIEGTFNITDLFNTLCEAHPATFAHLSYHPDSGVWIGASPEPLVLQEGEAYRTVSLAGTRMASNLLEPWGQKESLEQSIVTDYIKAQLVEAKATNIRISRPQTLRFGNIEHLKSDIRFACDTIQDVVAHLHPTPAVAGVPLTPAVQLINLIESHERLYYTGYVGYQGTELPTSYFVNLRCLQFHSNGLLFFTGGGITIDSEPDSEWLETRDKLNALLSHIKKL